MDDRWRFLIRWCSSLQGRIQYKKIEQENAGWGEHKFCLEVDLPKRYEVRSYRQGFALNEDDEAGFKLRMQKDRKALALLAAVARVDNTAWKWLLREKCHVKTGKPGEEKFEKEIPS
ncbi:hypothetical protein V7S43_004146 [Phytophthora oleae]|uniref:Uncharacterized protein n=1 Tax=Phytophthora oleae TaxID=2107226 RepID=A0ABD3FZ89_9STRA